MRGIAQYATTAVAPEPFSRRLGTGLGQLGRRLLEWHPAILAFGLGGIGAAALVAGLSACSNDNTQTPTDPGTGEASTPQGPAEGKLGGLLVIGAAVTASNQFAHNFNRYGGGDTAPGSDLLWDLDLRTPARPAESRRAD